MDKNTEEFMEKLREAINNDPESEKYGQASNVYSGNCMEISRRTNNYWVNIAFRLKGLKVEAKFNKEGSRSHYLRAIQDNWSEDKHEFCDKYGFSIQQLEKYSIEPYPAGGKKYDDFAIIGGSFKAQAQSKNEWDNYIAKALELIKIIIPLADFEFEKYPCEGSED